MILYLLKILICIPIILILIVLSLKISQGTLLKKYNDKYVKILDIVSINKNNSIIILKIGEEGCIIASSSASMNKIKDLTKEEISKIEDDIKERNFKIQDFKMEKIKAKYDFSRYIGKFTKKEDK
ncbi:MULTISPECIES: flagellar biosynthetic protein FliO [unclassified Clostridioides]|uniref:flagellar biosynthetic protein FliO n=1 Tax=unclassified Clostridioides TaxID=2635829 RepID=UPI001D121A1F|nr:FliO/MopB family protein [Clostridioides sp. ZZV14-6150]MCC0649522.1 FliO/MopB family protein [Clostridioides sp. ZZV15-6598]MCC0661019.1 FliO/MopB family protein [Clostridioides sp. ZZV14-6154]MCC0668265.1 FliO/MopB family protein [Clostridioides sp. ZZV14-6153]MCC0718144.1 FliO/MopB family protein [Clostridioides sp. ZZV14-6105]MCC0722560.1 FliO/MopB family protein [Clostridioides sp. ZZV14-6104]MCC0727070.1 FliO/MopB family protein [Clostridioides sp. ZZV14-6045]MCC0729871.1 FliO/MopB 